MRIYFARIAIVLMSLACVGMLVGPARADFKNFGIYQDTNANGVLDVGDTYIDGFMSWYTHYSAATSYNYGDHYVEDNQYPDPLNGFDDLTGAPYASDHDGDDPLSWLPMDDDELHIYMAWSHYDNNLPVPDPADSPLGEDSRRGGFALGMIANDFIRSRSDPTASGGYDLDIAIRNRDDGVYVPQVTLSDDPGEYYAIPDPDGGTDPYNYHFEGRWDYTASTGDGGVIAGIHNRDYFIDIDPSNKVISILGDGLVIRINPESLGNEFGDITKIVIYDFGYENGAGDTLGDTPPIGYVKLDENHPAIGIEIPMGIEDNMTFFIASIPDVVPEPSSLLALAMLAGIWVSCRRSPRS